MHSQMDLINLEKARFTCRIGVSEEERQNPQEILVDLKVFFDTKKAAKTDLLSDTIDWSQIHLLLNDLLEKSEFKLIESAAEKIANCVLTKFPASQVIARVTKPLALRNKNVESASVEISRFNTDVLIALGSNLGDRQQNLVKAVELIKEKCRILKTSPIYETPPMYNEAQGSFLNAAALVATPLSASELMEFLLSVEEKMGRVRTVKNAPRIIDLDLLFYGDLAINDHGLEIPHPLMQERLFVLQPLNDISPDYVHPVLKKTVKRLFSELKDGKGIRFFNTRIESLHKISGGGLDK